MDYKKILGWFFILLGICYGAWGILDDNVSEESYEVILTVLFLIGGIFLFLSKNSDTKKKLLSELLPGEEIQLSMMGNIEEKVGFLKKKIYMGSLYVTHQRVFFRAAATAEGGEIDNSDEKLSLNDFDCELKNITSIKREWTRVTFEFGGKSHSVVVGGFGRPKKLTTLIEKLRLSK